MHACMQSFVADLSSETKGYTMLSGLSPLVVVAAFVMTASASSPESTERFMDTPSGYDPILFCKLLHGYYI